MARGRFVARPEPGLWKKLNGPKGYILLKPDKEDMEGIREMLRTYERDAVRRVEAGEKPRDIAFEWDINYGKRTLAKNNLIWALLTLTVKFMNEGMPEGRKKLEPYELYDQDMGEVAPRRPIEVEAAALPWLAEVGVRVVSAVPLDGTTRVVAQVVKTSSKWDDREAHLYIEHLFNRLAMMGVPLPEDQIRLKGWWLEWMIDIETHRVELHAEEVSKDKYRELHPLCEATMAFIGLGGGHVHHIKSQGAGGAEPQLDKGSNWLHLSPEAHALWTAPGGGVKAFVEKYAHLKSKIERALGEQALGVEGKVKKSRKKEKAPVVKELELVQVSAPKAEKVNDPDGPNGLF